MWLVDGQSVVSWPIFQLVVDVKLGKQLKEDEKLGTFNFKQDSNTNVNEIVSKTMPVYALEY